MGVSRSASTVIAYAMKEYGWDLEQAFDYVKERRAVTKPNPSFMRQLEEYQGILLARYALLFAYIQNEKGGLEADWPTRIRCIYMNHKWEHVHFSPVHLDMYSSDVHQSEHTF